MWYLVQQDPGETVALGSYDNYVNKSGDFMSTTKQQVAMNLCYLTLGDSDLMNEIIVEYVDLIDKKRLDDLLEFTNNEMRANV